MLTMTLRHGDHRGAEAAVECKLALADMTVLRAELQHHICALSCILEVCAAVARGRYLEDHQQCRLRCPDHDCRECTSSEACRDCFDPREPYTVIADWLSDLSPLSDVARHWIRQQQPLLRRRHDLLFGPQGLFGGARLVMYHDDGSGVLTPMSEEDSAAALAAHEVRQDAKNESTALRLEQYDLNLERLADLCRMKGDLQEIAAIIEGGMPPQVRPAIVPS